MQDRGHVAVEDTDDASSTRPGCPSRSTKADRQQKKQNWEHDRKCELLEERETVELLGVRTFSRGLAAWPWCVSLHHHQRDTAFLTSSHCPGFISKFSRQVAPSLHLFTSSNWIGRLFWAALNSDQRCPKQARFFIFPSHEFLFFLTPPSHFP